MDDDKMNTGRLMIPEEMLGDAFAEHLLGADILHATVSVGANGERSMVVAVAGGISMQGEVAELCALLDATGMMIHTAEKHTTNRRARRHMNRARKRMSKAFDLVANDLPDMRVPDTVPE